VSTVTQRIDVFARWLLLTREGRRALTIAYVVLGVFSVVAYVFTESILYALVMGSIMVFGLWWARFCLRRPG
jgi:hypothetical protein